MSYKAGSKPGQGSYECMKCNEIVRVENSNDKLPQCPKCRQNEYKKK
ncbi:MAG: Zinc-ribbon containing domain [Haloplasmataceae bacterium]|jgi:DNA-directed RNA polymerase subunit RPC12/RpoP|nr:Zinc-ribbon containing domain [Haloplasmataceae bacterium]